MAKKQIRGGKRDGAGRPVTHPEGATTVLTARVPATLIEQLDAHAVKAGISRSEAVANAIRESLKTQ